MAARQGKCVYECVWLRVDEDRWFCCYAIDLYEWSRLGDVDRFGLRGCVGAYVPPGRDVPETAAQGARPGDTPLHEPLNPFADDSIIRES